MGNSGIVEKNDIARTIFSPVVEEQKVRFDVDKEQPQKVIVIGGPTCCGKTKLAIMLAKTLGGEVISADSMQIYQGMDIGTAKPSNEQQAAVPHHMIDICPVSQLFNVVDYYYGARHCCQTLLAQNRVPIVVGGACFYLHVFLYGPPEGPPSVPEIRKTLEKELSDYGVEALYERLQELDPDYAETITSHDKHKIVRALEIINLTKGPVSGLSWYERERSVDYDFRCWFIHRPKEALYRCIEERCEQMLQEGFIEEVEALEKEGLRGNTSAAQSIGYRQALTYLESERTSEDYDDFVKSFKQESRRYAKRQFTWFRKETLFRWLDIELHDFEIAVDMILNDYEQKR